MDDVVVASDGESRRTGRPGDGTDPLVSWPVSYASFVQPATVRQTVHRHPERARYDRATVGAILDEAFVCHLGFVDDGQPYVIPTMFARDGDRVIVHGSTASRMTK